VLLTEEAELATWPTGSVAQTLRLIGIGRRPNAQRAIGFSTK